VGSFGSVYKGITDDGRMTIVVKVLNLMRPGASKSFLIECEALRVYQASKSCKDTHSLFRC
jgi:hypothetical protein